MTPPRDPSQMAEAGMTLTEVLVAVFIMALAAGMVIMTIRPGADPLEDAATRLEQDVSAALDLALVTGIPQGLIVTQSGYQRVSWSNRTWVTAPSSAVSLSRGVVFDARRTSARTSPDKDPFQPDIVLDTTGIVQGERLRLVRGRKTIALDIAPNGDVTWEAPDA